jgi:hypothetical protein
MSAVSTGEQDGWAYVATGSETYVLWERQRQRMRVLLRETEKWNAVQRRLTDQHRASR